MPCNYWCMKFHAYELLMEIILTLMIFTLMHCDLHVSEKKGLKNPGPERGAVLLVCFHVWASYDTVNPEELDNVNLSDSLPLYSRYLGHLVKRYWGNNVILYVFSEVAKLTRPMMTLAEDDDEGEERTDPLILQFFFMNYRQNLGNLYKYPRSLLQLPCYCCICDLLRKKRKHDFL